MQANYIDSYIKQIPLFANLSPEQLHLVSQAFEVRSYRTKEIIFQEREPMFGMLTLISGQAVMLQLDSNGIQQPIATIIANQTINQEALFSDGVHSATLYVQRPVQALKLTREKFMTLLAHHPELKVPLGLSQKDTSHHVHDVRFKGQREDEEVLVYTRRHWWAFARMGWLPLVLMISLWLIAILIKQPVMSTILLTGSILFPGLTLLYLYMEWRNDAVIVTSQRVIRIWRTILTFSTRISEVGIQSIHEVNSEVPSNDPFARLFNYSTIQLKTAGDAGNLQLDLIPNPDQFQQIIIEDRKNYDARLAQNHRNSVRAELDNFLSGDTPERINHPQGTASDPSAPPKPKNGNYGYLRNRIEMTNGDIIYRKHILFWFQQTAIPILLMIFSIGELFISIVIGDSIGIAGVALGIVLFMIGIIAYFWTDWDWRNDYYVVSDDTITLIHQRPFFLENLRDQILMERVDNVVSESSGMLATLFTYGNVRVSLVGADEHKMFHNVAKPQDIQQEISRRQQRIKQSKSAEDARQQREIIGEYLNVFNERLQDQGLANQPTVANPVQPQPNVVSIEGQFSNSHQGTTTTPVNNTIPGRPTQPDVQVRAFGNRDRNRPPGIPRKRFPANPSKPSMTPGVPYNPDSQTGNRPPRFRPKDE
jgi:hypothetical protein